MVIYRFIAILLTFGLLTASATQTLQQRGPVPQQQTRSEDAVIRINVNLVQVDAVVTDSKGRAVTDLTKDDFEVFQDKRPQTITAFNFINVRNPAIRTDRSAPTARPRGGPNVPPPPSISLRPEQIRRTIALVVDDLGLSWDSTIHVKDSLKKWVDTQMQPGDLVAVIRTSAGMGSLQQFTGDKRLLYKAIDLVQYRLGRVGVSAFAPAAPAGAIDTSGFNAEVENAYLQGSLAAIRYVVTGLRNLPGRKSLILFSESLPIFNAVTTLSDGRDMLRKLADAANRSSVVINAIDPRGVVYTGPTAEDNTRGMTGQQIAQIGSNRTQQLISSQDGMVMLSHETGGIFGQNSNDIDGLLRQVVEDGDGYYLIGYQPDATTFGQGPNKFHSITVRLKRPGLTVRSRDGFYGSPDSRPTPKPTTPQAQIVNALTAPFGTGGDFKVRLTTMFAYGDKGGASINAMLYLDPHDLTFTQNPDGTRTAQFDVAAVTFDAEGQQIDGVDRTWRLPVPQDKYELILKTGMVYSTRVPIKKAGSYQMRVVLRDSASQQLGSATQFVEVPDVAKGKFALSGILMAAEPQPQTPQTPPDSGATPTFGDDPNGSSAVRIFKRGAAIDYAYEVFNAHTGRDNKPELESQIRLFRDGQQIYDGDLAPINAANAKTPSRLAVGGRLQLTQLTPGDYVLQVVVVDKQQKKNNIATQSMDFTVQ
jgi:VWFA-related protein